jgi:alginate O-acetyltransferase complex protein AlgI
MLFPTVDFAVFFVVVLAASWLLRPHGRAWRLFLVGASAVFYLDPFNPAHSGGAQFVTANPVILTVLAATVAAAVRLQRVAAPARAAAVTAGPAGPPEEIHVVPTGPAPWVVPAATTALVAVTNLAVAAAYPERAAQNSRWLLLLVGVALVNQAFARSIHASLDSGRPTPASRRLVAAAVFIDLAVLGWFKYAGWFAELWADLAGRFGVDLDRLPAAVLPIAISFFTFQAVSYVVDVGRGRLEPVSLLDVTLYLTFFPNVVAGPIMRAHELVPQLHERADPRYVASGEAFQLIFRGLFKKVVVSSYLGSQIVQPVFDAPAGFSRTEVLFAVLGFAVQIYADFSGYVDIAIGVALLLGIRLSPNFDAPYRAVSLQDFWRRWHMTLSRWLRDYLYIPLGGNRRGPSRTQVNILLTMLLGGLWHGASATFVVWGALHGGALVAERAIRRWWATRPAGPIGLPPGLVRGLQWAATMTVVCVAWVFFNARDVSGAFAVLGQLVSGEATVGAASRVTPVLVLVVVASLASQFVPASVPRRVADALAGAPPLAQAAAGAGGLLLITVLGPEGVAPFIYAQF